jgi:hypothetical protein
LPYVVSRSVVAAGGAVVVVEVVVVDVVVDVVEVVDVVDVVDVVAGTVVDVVVVVDGTVVVVDVDGTVVVVVGGVVTTGAVVGGTVAGGSVTGGSVAGGAVVGASVTGGAVVVAGAFFAASSAWILASSRSPSAFEISRTQRPLGQWRTNAASCATVPFLHFPPTLPFWQATSVVARSSNEMAAAVRRVREAVRLSA